MLSRRLGEGGMTELCEAFPQVTAGGQLRLLRTIIFINLITEGRVVTGCSPEPPPRAGLCLQARQGLAVCPAPGSSSSREEGISVWLREGSLERGWMWGRVSILGGGPPLSGQIQGRSQQDSPHPELIIQLDIYL